MKHILTKIFNKTFGVIFRAIQRSIDTKQPDLITELSRRAIVKSADYAEKFFYPAPYFWSRVKLWEFVVSNHISEGCLFLEFGVNYGTSLKEFAGLLGKGSTIYGFDSFEGLEENWYKGAALKHSISTKGKIPYFAESNITIIPGWYSKVLPSFLKTIGSKRVDLIHLDSDTYSPTKTVLRALRKNIRTGTILIFDEYFGYPTWEYHEHLAFMEFSNTYKIKYEVLGFTNNQVAFKIK